MRIPLLLTILIVNLCATAQRSSYLLNLKTRADFDLLKGEPLSKNFNGIECIKLVYELSTKKLYYVESKRYRWHHLFAKEVLGDADDLDQFNIKNYSNTSSRKYILATFNYNTNSKNYFLQFAASDNPSDDLIHTLTQKVKETFFLKDQFKILLNSTVLLRRKNEIGAKYNVLTSDELFKNQNYQPICKGKTQGFLRLVHADSISASKDYSKDILIINGSSNQLPVCKALVTNEFQTPLSHICLLTASRKTPCAAQKNIFKPDSLKQHQNQWVEITVGNDRLMIKNANPTALKTKEKKISKLKADTSAKALCDLVKLSSKNKKSYGSKVCNLAELAKIKLSGTGIKTPGAAFAIPFYYYMSHLNSHGINRKINSLLSDSLTLKNDSLLNEKLKEIRRIIKSTPLDSGFLSELSKKCVESFGNVKVRFRSSSNCEDEQNFNGAGLYTSATGVQGSEKKSIENAVKKVWASLWNIRAFRERDYFRIDHRSVHMAILVHKAFDNEILNGVAVTKNIYRSYDFGFVINMQKGEEEVVAPSGDLTCEQVVSYMNNPYADFYNRNRTADWISFSTLSPEKSLLSSDELYSLTQQLEAIKKHFYSSYNLEGWKEYRDFAMDVEFKLIEDEQGNRVFIFKQARPYNN